ncbi:anaerobic carbon-monoxide dehydrogenase catalytic subunit [candidate division CSSED10-310 bacterium]|uniref:Carbon monoxide dehydrogenase n=1 Tax=candidate division CSSED10-310 bacterium TaxID=2855610 RepID=A0ABV6Z3X3_UNCC1
MTDSKIPYDQASRDIFKGAGELSVATIWQRMADLDPQCGFGLLGNCCSNCNLGPCRIDPFGERAEVGACGATIDTIAARNLVRSIAAGCAAHSDHGRELVLHLAKVAQSINPSAEIKEPEKLKLLAQEMNIKTAGEEFRTVVEKVSEACLSQFTRHEGGAQFIKRAPQKRQEIWTELGITPGGIDRDIVEVLHRTNIGVDNDYQNLLFSGMKAALNDGWGGSMIATELTDILFGSPQPVRSQVNLGVLKKDAVNILIHGHEPIFANSMADMAQNKELLAKARERGAEDINIAGICCTASELLMRKGIPVAGSFLQQELALMTRAVDLMLVNYQCVMPSLANFARCFQSYIFTTSPKALFPGIEYVDVESNPDQEAEKLINLAIDAFEKRKNKAVNIPTAKMDVVAGFTPDNIRYHLGGYFRGSYRPLNDNIANGYIRGIAAIVGCDNPKMKSGEGHIQVVKELLKNDVLVIQTGCAATACAKEGLLKPEAAFEFAGAGLQQICEAIGIPPVLHNGSCVDNSRILLECAEMVKEGGLGEDISELPVAAAAPEWMSEKAIAISWYAVASGVLTVLGAPFRITGSQAVYKYLTQDIEQLVGGKFVFEADPLRIAHIMIEHINDQRAKLKLQPMKYTPKSDTVAVGNI